MLLLKNWRPISLLNTDYKIIAKVLSTRLQAVLPSVISNDQIGYLKGLYIGQNIRLLEDLSFLQSIITCLVYYYQLILKRPLIL